MRLATAALCWVLGSTASAQTVDETQVVEAPRSRVVGDFGVLGVVDLMPGFIMSGGVRGGRYGGEVLLPGFTLYGQAGVRLTPAIAAVMMTVRGRGILGILRGHMSVAIYKQLSVKFEAGLNFENGVAAHVASGLGGTFF